MELHSRSIRPRQAMSVVLMTMLLIASTADAQSGTDVKATGVAGSVLFLSTRKPGSIISPSSLVLSNIPRNAPVWYGRGSTSAVMGTWDVAAFVKALDADPAAAPLATIVAHFAPCYSPNYLSCSGDSNSVLVNNVLITNGTFNVSTSNLTLSISPEETALSLSLAGERRSVAAIDVIIQSYRATAFSPAMPTDEEYRPVWYDWANGTAPGSSNATSPNKPQSEGEAKFAVAAVVNSGMDAASPLVPSDAASRMIITAMHSLAGLTVRPVSCKKNCTNGAYSLVAQTSSLDQHAPFQTEDAADALSTDFQTFEEFVTTVQRLVSKEQKVKALLQLRTAPEKVLYAPVLLQAISNDNKTAKVSYTIVAEPGQGGQLTKLRTALRAAQTAASNGNNGNVAGLDAGLKLFVSPRPGIQLGGTLGCKAISATCPPPYLGTAFLALEAFPYSVPSISPGDSGIGAPGNLWADWLPNRSPFTAASLFNVAIPLTIDLKCDSSMSTSTYTSATELRRSWSTDAQVSSKFFGVTATASSTYKSVSNQLSTSKSEVTTSSIVCATQGFQVPPTLEGLQLDPAFVAAVTDIIANNYDITTMYRFYETYGSHFTKSVILGGYTTTTMRSSASSISSYQSSDLSVQASIAFGLASAKDQTTFADSQNNTAQAQGWSWSAVEAPAGASLNWIKEGSSLNNPPVPDMKTYVKDLAALPDGIYGLSPIRYSLQQLDDVFKTSKLWQPYFSNTTGLTPSSLSIFAVRYMAAVTGCFTSSALSGTIDCQLDDLSLNGGCGSLGYPYPDTPEGATFECASCMLRPTYKGSSGLAACPYTSDSCSWFPNITTTTTPKAVFGCNPPSNGIWSFNPQPADSKYEAECRTYTVGQDLDPNKACLLSPSGRYSFCLQWDADLLIKDLWEQNWEKQNLFSAYWDAEMQADLRLPGYPFFCQTFSADTGKEYEHCFDDWEKVFLADAAHTVFGKQYSSTPAFYGGDTVKLCVTRSGHLTASALTKKCVPFGISGEGALASRGVPDCTSDYSEAKWQRYFESKNWDDGNQGPYTCVMQDDGNLVVYNKNGFDGRNSAWHGPWQG